MMNRRTGVALILCAGLLLTACGSDAAQTAPSSNSTSTTSASTAESATLGNGTFVKPSDANRSDADSTAELAALMLHSWDTHFDRTQTAAAVRAKPLMSADWARAQVEPKRNGNQHAWLTPSEHNAYSSPSIIPAATDVTTNVGERKAIRVYQVKWRWISRDGYDLSAGQRNVTLYLERDGGQWEVVGHQFQEIDSGSEEDRYGNSRLE